MEVGIEVGALESIHKPINRSAESYYPFLISNFACKIGVSDDRWEYHLTFLPTLLQAEHDLRLQKKKTGRKSFCFFHLLWMNLDAIRREKINFAIFLLEAIPKPRLILGWATYFQHNPIFLHCTICFSFTTAPNKIYRKRWNNNKKNHHVI